MPIDEFLGDIIESAFNSISNNSNHEFNNAESIKLSIDNTASDCFIFYLYKYDCKFYWKREIIYKNVETNKYTNPLLCLQYIGEKLIPPEWGQEGITELEEVGTIFQLAISLLTLSNLDLENCDSTSEIAYSLQINLNSKEKIFNWKTIPPEWKMVNELANLLIALNNKLW